ncbi:reverse transcriptase [Penicillium atrosanguineum]|uniref:Reverse transcriptase n=1 Tax=Penicillium atrosanguineum TaxID=1132637 RepID=A0A9W9GQ08_9EURO|nr:reverse transcriptase [Penicillium atrosanguineum]KAJ5147174.1 reverse transcriptase [Penicillium atrosanguineum]KAJ5331515.1 reverse transcriptase [Penicillium atrosanguineum]
MSSLGALPQTLKSITATKIKELSKQRTLFDKRKEEIFANANSASDLPTRVRILLDGLSHLKGYSKDSLNIDDLDLDIDSSTSSDDDSDLEISSPIVGQMRPENHANIRRFLLQGRYDPSITEATLLGWVALLEKELRYLELKHEHAAFYSRLVTEWLTHLDEKITSSAGHKGGDDKFTESDTSFENVGRAEMHEQRAKWESLVFTAPDYVDKNSVWTYLETLFTKTKLSQQALKELRESIRKFANNLASQGEWLDVDKLKWVSKALIKADLLSAEKSTILKEFMQNKEVTQEVVDVLNMRLASLDSWDWGSDGIPIEMRRHLNGKYRVFMDEDLLDGLFLQYLGSRWAVMLRKVFTKFLNSYAWSPMNDDVPDEHKDKRKYFQSSRFHTEVQGHSINELRKETYYNDYFMSQLPESTDDGTKSYDDDSQSKNALDTKHSLLHLLVTESLIHKTQRGEFTAIRSDYEWFGPGLPHATILTVMEYFGVPEMWLKFFKVFLEAPLKFVQDGLSASTQVRKRGVPMSHTLSDCFGESILFCMDYAVNQSTNGGILYRLHDDFWFWGAKITCEKAWLGMTEFANVMGLRFNDEKTGTVLMGKAKVENSSVLPVGNIRWGFLVMDAEQGKFVIDQAQVDQHIEELDLQLSSCKTIFSWVEAWNSYFGRFFTNNFAKPAMCFGRDHIDMAICTLSRIEKTLFSKRTEQAKGGVSNYLRGVIAERFDIHGLPEGFFYYPVELGGLGLLNPFVRLLAMRENIKHTPERRLQKASLQDEMLYQSAKEKFEKRGSCTSSITREKDGKPLPFWSLEEFTKYPETYSFNLLDAYKSLNEVPEEKSVSPTASFKKNQAGLKGKGNSPISSNWGSMTPYWRWVAEMYSDEMVSTYGGLAAVSREFMPLGVVKTLKEGRFRWQG